MTTERVVGGNTVRETTFAEKVAPKIVEAKRVPRDTREWLARASALGELKVLEGVDCERGIGQITEMLHHDEEAPAVLFDDIPGYPKGYRMLVNTLSRRNRLAMTIGLDENISAAGVVDAWEQWLTDVKPLPVNSVASGPITENIDTGDDVDLLKFPTPLWHEEDGGRYIGTAVAVVTRDPDTGVVNYGTYRAMVHDRNHTGLYISPGKHGRAHQEAWMARGEPMPCVMLVGLSPLHFLGAALEIPEGVNELEWLGGVTGEPVDCIEGTLTGLPIPAGAEIALEGFVLPDEKRMEGPFGEWTGYYASKEQEQPVFRVDAVYHRDDPIMLGCPPQKPPYEGQKFQQYGRSANLRRELRAAGVPGVTAAWAHSVGGCRLFNVVAIKQQYAGHATQAGLAAVSCRQGTYLGRVVVVVDEDIDVTDLHEVIWAVCTRHDPERDVQIIKRTTSGNLDPAIEPGKKGYNSRLLIDATRPWEWRDKFPAAMGPEPEEKAQVREDWGWILRGGK
jgi:4-hydroxy-3-polyprenylbenzoate decarboxylase